MLYVGTIVFKVSNFHDVCNFVLIHMQSNTGGQLLWYYNQNSCKTTLVITTLLFLAPTMLAPHHSKHLYHRTSDYLEFIPNRRKMFRSQKIVQDKKKKNKIPDLKEKNGYFKQKEKFCSGGENKFKLEDGLFHIMNPPQLLH